MRRVWVCICHRFEDGTVDFLSAIAVGHGLDTLRALAGPMREVAGRTFRLAAYLYGRMSGSRHGNGLPVFRTYADTEYRCESTQGGVVNFNVLRANGDYVGYNEVSGNPVTFLAPPWRPVRLFSFLFSLCGKEMRSKIRSPLPVIIIGWLILYLNTIYNDYKYLCGNHIIIIMVDTCSKLYTMTKIQSPSIIKLQ